MIKIYNAGTDTIEKKKYTIKDNNGLQPISRLIGENSTIFGGRVTHYARAKNNFNYILLIGKDENKFTVIDIAVTDLSKFPREILKLIAKRKKKKFAGNILDKDLVNLIK